jgi:hypothetical protein
MMNHYLTEYAVREREESPLAHEFHISRNAMASACVPMINPLDNPILITCG